MTSMNHLSSKFLGSIGVIALIGTLLLPASVGAQMRGLPDFTELVDQVGPSVVNIRTLEKVSSRNGSSR